VPANANPAADGRENVRAKRPPAPRDARGRFAVIHGADQARRRLRQGDRRRSLVRQAEALRDLMAMAKGFTGWGEVPEPLRGLIELAAEVRIYRRHLARPLWRRQDPPKRYVNVGELERRCLVALGIPGAVLRRETLEGYLAMRYGRGAPGSGETPDAIRQTSPSRSHAAEDRP